MNEDFITAREAAPFMGVSAQAIRNQAHKNPKALGFPVVVVGKRVLIPRKPFFDFIKRGGASHETV